MAIFLSEQPMFNHAPNQFWLIGARRIRFLFFFTLRYCPAIARRTRDPPLWKRPSGHCRCQTGASGETSLWTFPVTQGSYCTGRESGRIWRPTLTPAQIEAVDPQASLWAPLQPPSLLAPPTRSGCCSVNSSWLLPHRWGVREICNAGNLQMLSVAHKAR